MTSAAAANQGELFPELQPPAELPDPEGLHRDLRRFDSLGTKTFTTHTLAGGRRVPVYVNEFWTAKQRAANSLHEVSYRACFKPQLPRFFIERLTEPGDAVYDPFLGRGTTMIEAALLSRRPLGCDINPLSERLVWPRLVPPRLEDVAQRLGEIDLSTTVEPRKDLLVFYHPETLQEINGLRTYLAGRRERGETDDLDRWIEMVAINRLTGHSRGFFSVYTLPPNQAVSSQSQQRINERRDQKPERRLVPDLILCKTKALLAGVDDDVRAALQSVQGQARVFTEDAASTGQIKEHSVRLVVTSPPFLDVVQYREDNWLRCWFCGIEPDDVEITMHRRVPDWQDAMTRVFRELARVLQPGGHVAFEVGEVRGGSIKLEEVVWPCGLAAGLEPVLLLINDQKFTKTANCWGIDNNRKGTNTNRVVVFRAP